MQANLDKFKRMLFGPNQCNVQYYSERCRKYKKSEFRGVTADILAHQVLLNRVPKQATEDSVRYQIYY